MRIPEEYSVEFDWILDGTNLSPLQLLVKVDMDTPLHELFHAMPWSSWEDANLDQVVVYLRGCQKLAIPDEFRPVLPQEWNF